MVKKIFFFLIKKKTNKQKRIVAPVFARTTAEGTQNWLEGQKQIAFLHSIETHYLHKIDPKKNLEKKIKKQKLII